MFRRSCIDAGRCARQAAGLVVWLTVLVHTSARAQEPPPKQAAKPAELTAAQQSKNVESFEVVWKTIRDKHFDLYAKVECVGIEDVESKPAYKIVLTPKSGKPGTEYYDKKSHLLVKATSTVTTPMGDIVVDTYPSDYKSVDGVLIPFTATQKVLTQEIVMKMTEIKHNVELPADAFRRPVSKDEPAKKKAE